MSKERHKEWHYFLLTDYDKEEKLLREKHKKGEKFVRVEGLGIYTFDKCEPEDMVYRLDFHPKTVDRADYLQLFADYGWEYIQDFNEYSYFRKSAKDADEKDLEIFSDDESRLEMLDRIFKRRMLPILLIFLLCLTPQCLRAVHGDFTGISGYILTGLLAVLFVWYVCVIIYCGVGFYRLRKKYTDGVK